MPLSLTTRPLLRARRAAVLLPLAPVLALTAPSAPAHASAANEVTLTYSFTGAPRVLTVPDGVVGLRVRAVGAAGGDATSDFDPHPSAHGGRGAVVEADVTVSPGDIVVVRVGGQGGGNDLHGGASGWNGGGSGGVAAMVGAGGGGASDVRVCAAASDCDALSSREVVAGGGGGAGFSEDAAFAGGDAGSPGAGFGGVRGPVEGGGAGTAEAGGTGGAAGNEYDRISVGGDGGLGVGGVGGGRTGPDSDAGSELAAFVYRGAGGGGGGLYGGGGGGDNRYYGASGGGGSSLVPDGGTLGLADVGAEPQVTLTFTLSDVYVAPTIASTVSSALPRTAGWYRAPVRVSFGCAGSLLVTDCPAPVTLTTSGRDQQVTGSVSDFVDAHASTTATVSIDRTKPVVRVTGARNGATYPKARRLICKASDTFSGVGSCTVTTKKRSTRAGTQVRWTGTAVDKAGNRATTTGRYTIRKRS